MAKRKTESTTVTLKAEDMPRLTEAVNRLKAGDDRPDLKALREEIRECEAHLESAREEAKEAKAAVNAAKAKFFAAFDDTPLPLFEGNGEAAQ